MKFSRVFLSSLFFAQQIFAASSGPSLCEIQAALAEAGVDAAWLPYSLERVQLDSLPAPVLNVAELKVGDVVDVLVGKSLVNRSVVFSRTQSHVQFRSLELRLNAQVFSVPFNPKGFVNSLAVDDRVAGAVVGQMQVPTLQPGAGAVGGPAIHEGYLIEELREAHVTYLKSPIAIGDIISCRRFAFATKKSESRNNGVVPHSLILDSHLFGEGAVDGQHKRVLRPAKVQLGGRQEFLDLTAYDASRGSAPFLVVAHRYREGNPGAILYTALRLEEGRVRLPFEFVSFSQQSSFNHSVEAIVHWGSAFPRVDAK